MLLHTKESKITDDQVRLIIFEQNCCETYGYTKIKLKSGEEFKYTSMIKPECIEQYKNGKIKILYKINLQDIESVEAFFDTEKSQDYFQFFIKNEPSEEFRRIKLLRDRSPLNLIVSPNKKITSLQQICIDNHEHKKSPPI